jgi:hypothetical protein
LLTAIKTVDGSGSGLDADTVDGIQASSFLRNDASNEITAYTNRTRFVSNTNAATSSSYQSSLEVFSNGAGNDAFMQFHVGGDYATYFGLDGDTNDLFVGGWSKGTTRYKMWHAGNDGSGSGLDADLLDGNQASAFATSAQGTLASNALPKAGGTMTGELTVPSMVLAGSIYHQGDTDNYFGFHTTDQFRVVCAGQEVQEWGANYTKLNDNDYMYFGSGNDFRAGFNGTDMFFRNMAHANGDVYFQGEGSDGTNENVLALDFSGTRSFVKLYENSSERLKTTSTGVTVTGSVTLSGNITGVTDLYVADQILHTGDTDTYMQFHAADQWRVVTGGGERLEVNNTGANVTGNIAVSGTVDGRDIATNIPASLGTAGQVLTVNAGATAGEWADPAAGGSSIGAVQLTGYFDSGGTNSGSGAYLEQISDLNDWMMVGTETTSYVVSLPADQGYSQTRYKFQKRYRSFS